MGVFAAEVPEGSAAFDAGLRQGDLIQQVNHQAVRNAGEFLGAVNAAPSEQTVYNMDASAFFNKWLVDEAIGETRDATVFRDKFAEIAKAFAKA